MLKYKFSDFSLNGKNTFLENVLSFKESYNQKHKILTFCGVKFKLKNN